MTKEKKINASAILTKEVYEQIKEEAKKNKRSVSSQIAYMLEESLEKENK